MANIKFGKTLTKKFFIFGIIAGVFVLSLTGCINEDKDLTSSSEIAKTQAEKFYETTTLAKKQVETTSEEPATEEPATEEPATEKLTEKVTEKITHTGLGKEFKEAMDSYIKFIDEYQGFMLMYKGECEYNAIQNNLDDCFGNDDDESDAEYRDSIIADLEDDYAKYKADFEEYSESFRKWRYENLNDEEREYYGNICIYVADKLRELDY